MPRRCALRIRDQGVFGLGTYNGRNSSDADSGSGRNCALCRFIRRFYAHGFLDRRERHMRELYVNPLVLKHLK